MSKQDSNAAYQVIPDGQTISQAFAASDYGEATAAGVHRSHTQTHNKDFRLNDPLFGNTGFNSQRKRILNECQKGYDEVGIIKNVIDLMSDFGIKGVRVRHEVPAVERFYQKWWDKVNGTYVSERFFNTLYRLGSAPIYRTFGVIGDEAQKEMRAKGNLQKIDLKKYKKNVIPTKYTIINPATVSVFGEDLAKFAGKDIYILELYSITKEVFAAYNKQDRQKLERELLASLPNDLRAAINKNDSYFLLDQDRFSIFHYKKDDWQNWPKPILYSILRDIRTLNKMKDADDAALDGVITKIRHWVIGRLGSTASETIIPTKKGIKNFENKLNDFLSGGSMDLITGPDIALHESNSDSYKFLGSTKYEPTFDSIYNGLGIPAVLRSDKPTSGSEQFISLKTLIERLNYGRSLLAQFWNEEFIRIQKALGFSKPAVLDFDEALIADEVQEKNLLIHLADRDIISSDAIRERFKFNSDIENKRIMKEDKVRGDKMPHKAGPFHNGNVEHEITKMLIQMGVLVPKESPDKDFNFVPPVDENQDTNNETGRPSGVIEDEKRKPKEGDNYRFSKSSRISDDSFLFAHNLYCDINTKLIPPYLKSLGKKNQRQLTKKEVVDFEIVKAYIAVNYILKYGKELPKSGSVYADLTFVPKIHGEYLKKILCKEGVTLAQKQSLCIIYCSELLQKS